MSLNKFVNPAVLIVGILLLGSCGGGGYSGNGDPYSTSAMARGAIDGFGSVFVNGVEYETGGAKITVDGTLSNEAALRLGMMVTVDGAVNTDGVSGTAASITFDDEVQGPVVARTLSTDGDKLTLLVLGVTIIADRSTTVFDDVTFGSLAIDDVIEVSGSYDGQNQLVATRIEKKATFIPGASEVELKGTVTGLSGTTFTIGAFNVDFSSADLSGVPGGVLADGLSVEITGTLTDNTISATHVKVEADIFSGANNTGKKISIEGVITDFVSASSFKLQGIAVDASSATFEPSNLVLANNLSIEAEGVVANGILMASKIETEGGGLKLNATVQSVNSSTNEIVLVYASGNTITVKLNSATRLDDGTGAHEVLSKINPDDFLEIRARQSGNGDIIASNVKRVNHDDEVIQGNVGSFTVVPGDFTGTITVMNITFTTTSATKFENADNVVITSEVFFSSLSNGDLIKIIDKQPADGIADEVEFEH